MGVQVAGYRVFKPSQLIARSGTFFVLLVPIKIEIAMRSVQVSAIILAGSVFLASCASSPLGKKVNEPFTGNAYESNNRFFRGTGKGSSSQDNIARGKADIDAKSQLAGQVNTTMKQVADQYLGQTAPDRILVAEIFFCKLF